MGLSRPQCDLSQLRNQKVLLPCTGKDAVITTACCRRIQSLRSICTLWWCLTKQAAFRQPCRHGISSIRLLKAAGPIQRQRSLQCGHPPSHSPHASAPWQQGCAACLQVGHLVLCGHMRAHARAAPLLRRQLAGCMHERPPHSLPAVPPVHHHVQHERRILHVRSHIRKLLWHHMLNNLYEATLGTILIAAAAQSLQDNADPARLPKMQHPCTILHDAEDL